jgi:hypothetical protein
MDRNKKNPSSKAVALIGLYGKKLFDTSKIITLTFSNSQ